MQTTFDDKAGHPADDQQRRIDNTMAATKGEPQTGGAAGRQQVASKDVSGELMPFACTISHLL
jgi:hypothetical protein